VTASAKYSRELGTEPFAGGTRGRLEIANPEAEQIRKSPGPAQQSYSSQRDGENSLQSWSFSVKTEIKHSSASAPPAPFGLALEPGVAPVERLLIGRSGELGRAAEQGVPPPCGPPILRSLLGVFERGRCGELLGPVWTPLSRNFPSFVMRFLNKRGTSHIIVAHSSLGSVDVIVWEIVKLLWFLMLFSGYW
jgi:hypothetical protein